MSDSKELEPSSLSKLNVERHGRVVADRIRQDIAPDAARPAVSLATILRKIRSSSEVPTLRDALKASSVTREHVTVETVFTNGDNPLEHLQENQIVESIDSFGDLSVAWIRDVDSDWFVSAWPTEFDGVYHLVSTVHSTDKRWRRSLAWLHRQRSVVRPFLNHKDVQLIGALLSEHGDVEVGRVTARSSLDGSSDTRSWRVIPGQKRPSYTEVLSSMEDQGYWVRTMTLHVDRVLSAHIRRVAGASYYSGDSDVFVDKVLQVLARAARDRRSLLSRRERSKETVRPISISLSDANLADSEATGEVIREVASLPKTTLAVFHRNPYLHLALLDEVDGSNFDVIVTDAKSIDIYPGYLATAVALSRVVDHISERFGGEEIASRRVRRYSLEELSLGR